MWRFLRKCVVKHKIIYNLPFKRVLFILCNPWRIVEQSEKNPPQIYWEHTLDRKISQCKRSYGWTNPIPTVVMQCEWQKYQHTKVTNPAFVEYSALQFFKPGKKDNFCMFMQTNKRHKQKTRNACAQVPPTVCTRPAEFLQTPYYRCTDSQ